MLTKMYVFLMSLNQREEGQGMVEYALLIGLIAVALIVIIGLFGDAIQAQFQAIIDAF